MDEQKWYIMWSSTARAVKTIKYVVSGEKVELWIPSFTQIDSQGEENILPIYPQYYFVFGTSEQCYKIENMLKKYRYNGIIFLKDDLNNLYYLSEDEIKDIKEVEQNFTTIHKNKCSIINVGSKVVAITGPLSNTECIVTEVKGKMLLVSFSIFQRELNVWLPIENCNLIS
jgi:transcription antitermination factor NusG